jgi:hypothetical protein
MCRQLTSIAVAALSAVVLASAALAGGPALRQENIPLYGVDLQVPASWVGVPASKVKALKFAYGVASPTPSSGFYSNMNLIVAPASSGETVREWLLGKAAATYLRLGNLRPVTIHGVPGLEYESTKLERNHGKPLLTLEYAFIRGDRGYLFTYTAPVGSRAQLEPLFRSSAATIRFVATPPVA